MVTLVGAQRKKGAIVYSIPPLYFFQINFLLLDLTNHNAIILIGAEKNINE
jgi:hypothetical protein